LQFLSARVAAATVATEDRPTLEGHVLVVVVVVVVVDQVSVVVLGVVAEVDLVVVVVVRTVRLDFNKDRKEWVVGGWVVVGSGLGWRPVG
jgi:hypothetical protein